MAGENDVAPSRPTLNVSLLSANNSATINIGIQSYGEPNTGTIYLYGGTTNNPTTVVTTTNNTSLFYTHSGLTSGARYYYRARAYNGSLWSDYSKTESVLIPGPGPANFSVTLREVNPESMELWLYAGTGMTSTGCYIEGSFLDSDDYFTATKKSERVETPSNGTHHVVITNQSSGSLTIVPNTQYYYGGYATNVTSESTIVGEQIVTPCYPPTITVGTVDATTAEITITVSADGGFYRKQIEYSFDNGATWTYLTGFYTGDAATKTKTLNNLIPGHTYRMKYRVVTDAGTNEGSAPITFTTTSVPTNSHIYGSVNGETKRIERLYCSVNGQTKAVSKLYGSANGQTKLIYEGPQE